MEIVKYILALILIAYTTVGTLGIVINVMMNAMLDGFIQWEKIKAKKANNVDGVTKVNSYLYKHRKRTLIEALQWFIWPYYAIRRKGIFAPLY